MLFSTVTYAGQGSWFGRIAGVLAAIALSMMVVAMYYYGSKLVYIAASLRAPDAPVVHMTQPEPRQFPKSDVPGAVSVQILHDSQVPTASTPR